MDEFEAAAVDAKDLPPLPDPDAPSYSDGRVTDENVGAVWCDHVERPVPEPKQIDRTKRQFTSRIEAEKALGISVDPKLDNVFLQPRIEQRSPQWYLARQEAITASDFGAASKDAEYGSQIEVFKKKVETGKRNFSQAALDAMAYGVKHEDSAAYAYEQRTGNTILDFGLLTHWRLWAMRPAEIDQDTWFTLIHSPKRPECISEDDWAIICDLRWLKGSPDGITHNGILIEIKCPRVAFVPGVLKRMYNAQLQLNMEVAGCDRAHFIQYNPRESWLFGEKYDCFEVTRDGEWFRVHKQEARVVWDWVLHYRRTGTLPDDLVSKIRHVEDDGSELGEISFESTRAKRQPRTNNRNVIVVKSKPSVPLAAVDAEDAEWTLSAVEEFAAASTTNEPPPLPPRRKRPAIRFDADDDDDNDNDKNNNNNGEDATNNDVNQGVVVVKRAKKSPSVENTDNNTADDDGPVVMEMRMPPPPSSSSSSSSSSVSPSSSSSSSSSSGGGGGLSFEFDLAKISAKAKMNVDEAFAVAAASVARGGVPSNAVAASSTANTTRQ